MNIILGIDPGLQKTGWGVIEFKNRHASYISSGIITTLPSDAMQNRLLTIYTNLLQVMAAHKPSTASIERTYVNKNNVSSLKLAHARAAAMLTVATKGIPISEYQAKTVKKVVTGSGSADKMQMIKMISVMFPETSLKEDDSDAVAIALCHAYNL